MNGIAGNTNFNNLSAGTGFGSVPYGQATSGASGYAASSAFQAPNFNANALGMLLLQGMFQPMDSLLGGWQGMAGLGGGYQNASANPMAQMAQLAMMFQMIQTLCAYMQPQQQNYSQALAYQPQHDYNHERPMQQPQVNVAVAVHEEAPQAHVEVAVAAAGGDGGGGGGDGGGGGAGGGDGGGGTPVILDLNGDGKLGVGGKGGPKINFDLFGNGNVTGTEWLAQGTEDGLLVADFDGNGQIDSGRELMRNTGVNGEQGKYKNGWDKVRQLFDTNKDGKVAGDELNKMSVWVDKNADGKTDPGELQSLASRGVSEIELPPGDTLLSSFTMNGRRQMAYDYDFELAPPKR